MYKLFFFVLMLIPFLGVSQNEKEWNKEYQKIESQYHYGNYYQSTYGAQALLRKMNRKNWNSEYTLPTKALILKYKAAMGLRLENTPLVDELITTWQRTSKTFSDSAQIIGNIVISKTAIAFNKYYFANTLIEVAASHLDSVNDPKGSWAQQIRITKMELYVKTMNYNRALEHIEATIDYQKKLTTRTTEVVKKRTGETIDKKLPKKEYRQRLNTLGYLNILHAKIYRELGDFNQADTLFAKNEQDLSGWKSRNDESYILNEFEYTLLRFVQGDYNAPKRLKKTRNKYAQNIKYSIPNIQYNYMYENELRAYLTTLNFTKHAQLAKQYQREVTKNYSSKSCYSFTSKHLLQLSEFYKGKYKTYAKHVKKQAASLPKYYSETDASQIHFLNDFAEAQIKVYDFKNAEKTLNQIIDICEVNFDSSSMLTKKAFLQLGSFYVNNTTEFLKADSIFAHNFEDFITTQLHPFHPLYEKFLGDYALIDRKRDLFIQSIKKYSQLSSITKKKYGELTEEHGIVLERMARVQMDLGHFPSAEKNLQKAVLAFETDKRTKSLNYVYTLQALGEVYQINGDYANAARKLSDAFELAKKFTSINEMLIVDIDESLAGLYIEVGNYEVAEEILEVSSQLKTTNFGVNHAQLIKTNRLKGSLYLRQGKLIDAEKAIQKAIEISRLNFGENSLTYLKSRALLIEVYYQIGDLKRASNLATNIIHAYERKLGHSYLGIADVLIQKTRIELDLDAKNDYLLSNLNRAAGIVIQNVGDRHPKIAEVIELKALIMIRKKELDVALIQLQAANLIFTSSYGDNHPKTADNQLNIAALYYQSKNYDNALAFYNKALEIYQKVFNSKHPKYIYTQGKIGWVYFAQGNFEDAYKILRSTTQRYVQFINDIFPSLSSSEKERYWNKIQPDFAVFNSLATKYYTINPNILVDVYNNRLATKALLINANYTINQQIWNYGTPDDINNMNRLRLLKDSLIWAESYTMSDLDTLGYSIQRTRESINRIEKQLSERSKAISANMESKRLNWELIKGSLTNREAAMEIIRVNYFDSKLTDSVMYVALITKRSSKNYPEIVILNNGNDLEGKYYNYYQNTIKQKLNDTKSYAQFWEYFDAHLHSTSTIYISADGVYNQLNPETLKNKQGQYLLHKYSIYNVSNTSELVKQKFQYTYKSKNAVLIGNPNYQMNFKRAISKPLPDAKTEVKTIDSYLVRKGWDNQVFIGKKATEKAIKEIESPRIVHIATHGYFMENTEGISEPTVMEETKVQPINPLLRSGLLFAGADSLLALKNVKQINKSNGVLTALEVLNLDLHQTELVFLSACETGKRDIQLGDGIFGLQHAFKVAGAQNVIMTLFKVDDKITEEFVQIFYSNWIKTGDKRMAFTNAKKAILTKYKYPIYWGAFVMIGLD